MQAQLEELKILNRDQLAKRWQECFGVPAPNLTRSTLLRQAIAWHLQTQALGGLSLAERRQIQSGITRPSTQPSIGTRLIRVWQDQTHQITVLEDGYLYQDKRWKSLSAIAKYITGTPWSGPVFFGLKKAK
ncbi:DUF2924 domain-containing protein [Polynucleobacter sp. 78F-HAINBA]|jgi:hypothetical protein|uniref:DUF2924 domain-containing protein n=1 Tax=Polynucleobacter sp. 78F-HAINBA TaxID=2689099 RepID=UPI001C0D73F2|nr:DUF2924 domain-containing protein [Polynucleobacter sp. 78F-HAINBA]MBU3590440.1 DUF2924 domain-containing protein [Polynucleobacter sp. 78F-HAINBA]